MRFRLAQLILATAALALCVSGRAAAMTFETVSGPAECAARTCILAIGSIDEHTGHDFDAYVRANPVHRGDLLILDSPGGHLLQSLVLGNEIRDAGLSTEVAGMDRSAGRLRDGTCASACVYAFLGGIERTADPGARIGVHQPSVAGDDWAMTAPEGLWLMSKVAAHVNHLCGRLDLLIPAMGTSAKEMHWFSKGELRRFAVVTAERAEG